MNVYFDGLIFALQKSGGISRYFYHLIQELAKETQTELLVPTPPRGMLPPVPTHRTYNPLSALLKGRFTYANEQKFNAYIQKIGTGVLHSSYYQLYPQLSVPVAVTVYDLIHEQFPQWFSSNHDKKLILQKKAAIESASAVICISNTVRKQVLKKYQVSAESVFSVPLGVESVFKPNQNKTQVSQSLKQLKLVEPYYLHVGNRRLYKNFVNLVRAYHLVAEKSPRLLVCVGGGNFSQEEIDLIRQLDLENKVINLGQVPDKELAVLYAGASAYLSPSLAEGFGLPLLEAMACGCPPLVSNIPVYKEVAGDIPNYFDPRAIDSIAHTLSTFIPNKKKIKAGIQLSTDYTWKNTAAETLKIYQSIYEI